jgi:hypothetical protein
MTRILLAYFFVSVSIVSGNVATVGPFTDKAVCEERRLWVSRTLDAEGHQRVFIVSPECHQG